jgi:hypothetical protein
MNVLITKRDILAPLANNYKPAGSTCRKVEEQTVCTINLSIYCLLGTDNAGESFGPEEQEPTAQWEVS